MKLLSLGAGRQSSALLCMDLAGEFSDGNGPTLDGAIFADTGAETEATYRHLEWLKCHAAGRIPIHVVSGGNIMDDMIESVQSGARIAQAPIYTERTGAPLKRACTTEYKVEPVTQKVRELVGLAKRQKWSAGFSHVEQWIGFSTDEAHRMKPAHAFPITFRYPLIEKSMNVIDCENWLRRRGLPVPRRSSCKICPYRKNVGWRAMRDEQPEEWGQAVSFDEAIRSGVRGSQSDNYLHRTLVPLRMVDLTTPEDAGQLSTFDDLCPLGECGL